MIWYSFFDGISANMYDFEYETYEFNEEIDKTNIILQNLIISNKNEQRNCPTT